MKRFLHSIALLFSMVFVAFLLFVQSGKVFSQPVFPVPDHIVVAIFENMPTHRSSVQKQRLISMHWQMIQTLHCSSNRMQLNIPANRIILIFIPGATRE